MRISRVIFYLLFTVVSVSATEYHVDGNQKNLVKFISDAPVEDFEGVTSKIDGYVVWEGDSMMNKSQLYIVVDLNSLDTGIGLRNRHMRENYLHTDKFPETYFKGKITKVNQISETDYLVTSEGTMFIHGIERPVIVEGRLSGKDKSFQVTANFEVRLSDYNIEIPSIMFYKIDEVMSLHLNFFIRLAEKR
jgi:polyisoprenoid-binding protein YceI